MKFEQTSVGDCVKELRDVKFPKKVALEGFIISPKMLSSCFTEQIKHAQNFVTRLRDDLFPKNSQQNS